MRFDIGCVGGYVYGPACGVAGTFWASEHASRSFDAPRRVLLLLLLPVHNARLRGFGVEMAGKGG